MNEPCIASPADHSDLLATYERRMKHAEEHLRFWMAEFAASGDGCARVQMDRAHSTLGDINEQIYKPRQPGRMVWTKPDYLP